MSGLILDKCPSLAFSELKLINLEDVTICLTKEAAMHICQKSVQDDSTKPIEVLSLWLRKFIQAFSTAKILNVEEWQELMSFLQQTLEIAFTQDTFIDDYGTYIYDLLQFIKCSKQLLINAEEDIVCIVSSFVLTTIIDFTKFYNKHERCNLSEHKTNIIALHELLLKILSDIVEACNMESNKKHYVPTLLAQLVEANKCLKTINLNASMWNWYTVAKVCVHALNCAQFAATSEWLTKPILMLLKDIEHKIVMIYKEELSESSKETTEKFLRVINYFLHFLNQILIADDDANQLIEDTVAETFFQTLLAYHCVPDHLTDTFVKKLLEDYVHAELFETLQVLCEGKGFLKAFLDYVTVNFKENVCYNICTDYLNIVVFSLNELSTDTLVVLKTVFELVMKDVHYFLNENKYDRLIELYAAVAFVDEACDMINYFRIGVFNSNLVIAHACTDVLLVILCILHSNDDNVALQHEFQFWLNANNKFSRFSTNPSQSNVQRLLKLCYKYLPQGNIIVNALENDIKNYRFLQCVGVKSELADVLKKQLSDYTADKLTPVKYYEMIMCMELSANCNTIVVSKELILNYFTILRRLVLDAELSVRIPNQYKLFIETFFKLVQKAEHCAVLSVLEQLHNHPRCTQFIQIGAWHMFKFLHACRLAPDPQLSSMAKKFWNAANTDAAIGLYTNMRKLFDQTNSKPLNNLEFYTDIKYIREYVCSVCTASSFGETKKLVKRMHAQSVEIINCLEDLQQDDVKELNSIIRNLESVVKKYKFD